MEESKKCLKCGNIVKADAKFCTNCGSSEFCGCNPGETVNQNVNPVPPVYQPPVNVNQRPPKRKTKV